MGKDLTVEHDLRVEHDAHIEEDLHVKKRVNLGGQVAAVTVTPIVISNGTTLANGTVTLNSASGKMTFPTAMTGTTAGTQYTITVTNAMVKTYSIVFLQLVASAPADIALLNGLGSLTVVAVADGSYTFTVSIAHGTLANAFAVNQLVC